MPEPFEVLILFRVYHNLSVMIAEKEKFTGRVLKGYSPHKSGSAFLGIFSLSKLEMFLYFKFY